MGFHPRIETTNIATFATTKSRNSELWFVNNNDLEHAILGYLAKYTSRYRVKLYAFAIEGNHTHDAALFPYANRSHFMRDLNSSIARAIPRYCPSYPGGRFWGRRYSAELVPTNEDIERQFFYIVLQAVKDGLVDKLSQYPGYNCFSDAVSGIIRKFKVMNWGAYHDAKRFNPNVAMKDFVEIVELKYERLPGYEEMPQADYKKMMLRKLEEHRQEILAKRDKPAAGRDALLRKKPGSKPYSTKTSSRYDHRPRVICSNPTIKEAYVGWYFRVYNQYKDASYSYRNGVPDAAFPPGTYKPPKFTILYEVSREDVFH